MINTIIFDFDGTLADTMTTWISVWNFFAEKYGYKVILPEDYQRLHNMPSWDIKKELRIPWWRVLMLERPGRKRFSESLALQKFQPQLLETVKLLKNRGYLIGILTWNSKENVDKFLKNNHGEQIFDFVEGDSFMFWKGRAIKKLLRKYNIDPLSAIYVGDETRDVEAARYAGVKIASVTWGVGSKKVLQLQQPDWVIERPEELLKLV